MKIFNLFIKVFSVFAFLTLGSLLMMVALHVVTLDDLMRDLSTVYENPETAFQTFLIGLLFIFIGLAFAKMIIKQTRYAGGLIYTGPLGRTTVSVNAIEDVIRKVLKKYTEIIHFTLKCRGYEKKAELKIRLVIREGVFVPAFSDDLQQEIHSRLEKVLGLERQEIELYLDIRNVKESESFEEIRAEKAS